jgi:hypothetical protein
MRLHGFLLCVPAQSRTRIVFGEHHVAIARRRCATIIRPVGRCRGRALRGTLPAPRCVDPTAPSRMSRSCQCDTPAAGRPPSGNWHHHRSSMGEKRRGRNGSDRPGASSAACHGRRVRRTPWPIPSRRLAASTFEVHPHTDTLCAYAPPARAAPIRGGRRQTFLAVQHHVVEWPLDWRGASAPVSDGRPLVASDPMKERGPISSSRSAPS